MTSFCLPRIQSNTEARSFLLRPLRLCDTNLSLSPCAIGLVPADIPPTPEMDGRNERGFQTQNLPRSPDSYRSRFEQQPPQSNEPNQRQYSPPPFHTIPQENRHIPQPDPPTMNGVPLHAFRPMYDNNWQSPPSPPRSSTRSRLADEQLVRPHVRLPPENRYAGDKDRPRVKYRRRSRSSSYDSDSSYETRRRSRTRPPTHGGRSDRGSKAGNQLQVAPPAPPAPPESPKTGLEAFITPLRLGILLGCFDIIGGSLSVWMTRKRFGKAAQQAAADGQQQASERQSRVSSKHPRGDDRRRYHPYDSQTGSETDSDYEERQRRTVDHVREQRRLEYERDRGLGRARDIHVPHVRRR